MLVLITMVLALSLAKCGLVIFMFGSLIPGIMIIPKMLVRSGAAMAQIWIGFKVFFLLTALFFFPSDSCFSLIFLWIFFNIHLVSTDKMSVLHHFFLLALLIQEATSLKGRWFGNGKKPAPFSKKYRDANPDASKYGGYEDGGSSSSSSGDGEVSNTNAGAIEKKKRINMTDQ